MQYRTHNWTDAKLTLWGRFTTLIILYLLLPACGSSGEEQVDPEKFPLVVARVNGREIDRIELISRAGSIQKQAEAHGKVGTLAFYRSILDELIVAELLLQEAEKQGLSPPAEEIAERMNAIRERFPSEEDFQATLASQNLTRTRMAKALWQDLAVKNLIENQLAPKIEVTREEVQDYYSRNPDAFTRPEQVRASHILIALGPNASAAQKQGARSRLLELRRELEQGADFAELAREYSEDKETASAGGDLKWIRRGQTLPQFEEALFALPEGGLSQPVETSWGLHLIQVNERRGEKKLSFQEAQTSAFQFLRELRLQQLTAELAAGLREDAQVEVFI